MNFSRLCAIERHADYLILFQIDISKFTWSALQRQYKDILQATHEDGNGDLNSK